MKMSTSLKTYINRLITLARNVGSHRSKVILIPFNSAFQSHYRKKFWNLSNLRVEVSRPVTRGVQGDSTHLKNCSLPLEKCVGHSLKLLDIVLKNCLKLLDIA